MTCDGTAEFLSWIPAEDFNSQRKSSPNHIYVADSGSKIQQTMEELYKAARGLSLQFWDRYVWQVSKLFLKPFLSKLNKNSFHLNYVHVIILILVVQFYIYLESTTVEKCKL